MPVSHLGLTVSHIPSATSFYLAALQPLGYHYIGQQGNSIGLGIIDADFFLCQERSGTRASPNHIAFTANNRLTVRNCYAAALNAGGRPSGAPSYRNGDCSCFNAAVEDLDGNTIEFIYREPCKSEINHELPAPSANSRVETWQENVSRSGLTEDVQSLASKTSRTKSRAQTALDLASTTSKSLKPSTVSMPGITRSRTEPVTSNVENGGKTIVGTLLGAAAGAAVAYAMCQSEKDSAREESSFARSQVASSRDGRSRREHEKSSVSKRSHRNYSTTESARTPKPPYRNMLAIESPMYEDGGIQDVISRYTSSRRPAPQRSQTYDAIEYAPKSIASSRGDQYGLKRSTTLPTDTPDYDLEAPRTAPASQHTSRRGSLEDTKLTRHDSGVSIHSHRSGRRSSTSTIKPSRRGSHYESAANVPLPSPKAQSYISAADQLSQTRSKAPSYKSAAGMPLPSSRVTSYVSAAQYPMPPSRTNGGYTDAAEESDGLGDVRTVVPDDSISCVDYSSKSKKSKSSSKSSRQSSKRSNAGSERTVRPAKAGGSRHSAQTLPVRQKEDHHGGKSGKRSTFSYV
ncbi:hypothetical protein LTR37_012487 [Vermiconidia calcicola]|uniref:Uncharacterized protein n=1 Tax=Vermiconidia calcicola TaxID=1690605 RepID=A0ACC3MZJ2_9PEZI|nr:hypothetical protein LTR37_012487 [Vermiconidia calcicola]